jgi:hypothetical protein
MTDNAVDFTSQGVKTLLRDLLKFLGAAMGVCGPPLGFGRSALRLGNLCDCPSHSFLDLAEFPNIGAVTRLMLPHLRMMFSGGTYEVFDPGKTLFGGHWACPSFRLGKGSSSLSTVSRNFGLNGRRDCRELS